MRFWLVGLMVSFSLLQAHSPLQAQSRTGTGGTGTGSGGFSSGTSGGGGQQRVGGGSGTGTGARTGQSNQNQQSINTSAGTSDAVERDFASGFVGRSDNTTRFIGNEQASTQRANQQIPDFGQRQTGNVEGGKPTRESKVRPVLRIAFPIPGASPASTAPIETGMLRTEPQLTQRMAGNSQFAGVAVTRQSPDTLVLDGVVHSERDRKLAEMYLRLEPGVRSVDNRLTVLPGQK